MEERIVILSFVSGEVYNFPFEGEDAADFFDTEVAKDLHLQESNCQYMVTTQDKINL